MGAVDDSADGIDRRMRAPESLDLCRQLVDGGLLSFFRAHRGARVIGWAGGFRLVGHGGSFSCSARPGGSLPGSRRPRVLLPPGAAPGPSPPVPAGPVPW